MYFFTQGQVSLSTRRFSTYLFFDPNFRWRKKTFSLWSTCFFQYWPRKVEINQGNQLFGKHEEGRVHLHLIPARNVPVQVIPVANISLPGSKPEPSLWPGSDSSLNFSLIVRLFKCKNSFIKTISKLTIEKKSNRNYIYKYYKLY